MAGNTHQYQMKRTSVSGRLANTTDSSNSTYIPAGALAVNFADKIVYTSDGTNLITIGTPAGANLTLNILTVNSISVGTGTVNSTIYSGTSNNANFLNGSSLSDIQGQIAVSSSIAYSNAISYSVSIAGTAYSNAVATAATDATNKAAIAYSNAVAYAANVYTNAIAFANASAIHAYTNAINYTDTSAYNAYANSITIISTGLSNGFYVAANSNYSANSGALGGLTLTSIQAQFSGNSATAYTNAIATSAIDASTKAATAYSNAVNYVSNGVVNGSIVVANSVYSQNTGALNGKSLNTIESEITGNAATAYANAVANAAALYQTTAGLSANVLHLTANSSNFIGSLPSSNVVSTTQLQNNLSNYAALSGATFTGIVNTSANVNVSGSLSVSGNLTIAGQTTFVNTTVISTTDKIIYLAANSGDHTLSDGSGIVVTNAASWTYNDPTFSFQSNVNITPSGNSNLNLGTTGFYWNTIYSNQIYGTLLTTNQPNITANNSTYFNGVSLGTVNSAIVANASAAYSNAILYAATIAGTSYSNAVNYISNGVTNGAIVAANSNYSSNSGAIGGKTLATIESEIAGNSATAYSNAITTAATDASNKASNAYSNAIAYAATIASTAYSNATIFSSNATNITSGNVKSSVLGSGTANSSTVLYGNGVWSTISSNVSINTAAAYTWSNTQTFNANISFPNNGAIKFSANGLATGNVSYFTLQNDNNFVFYNTATDGSQRPIWAVFTNSNTSPLNLVVPLKVSSALQDGTGSNGSSGYVLQSNGTGVNWVSQGAASVNTFAQFTWSNTQTFNSTVTVANSSGNTLNIYSNGQILADVFTGNVTGTASNASALGSISLATLQSQITGNAATAFSNAIANSASSAASLYQTTAGLAANVLILSANSTTYLGNSSGTIGNVVSWITGNSATAYANAIATSATDASNKAATAYSNAIATAATDASNKAATAYSNATAYSDISSFAAYSNAVANAAALYQTTAGLAANVATLSANLASFVSNSSGTLGNIQSYITGNSATAYSNAITYAATVAGTAYANAVANAAALYQTTAGLAANVAMLTANSANYLSNSSGTLTLITSWISGNSSTAYTNAINYSGNGISNGAWIAANATYSSNTGALGGLSLTTVQGQITGNAAAAYANAVANTTYQAGVAYSNAVNYVSNGVTNGAIVAANSVLLSGQPASFYTNATNINTGTLPYAQLPANVVISSNNTTFAGTTTHNANLTISGANSASVFQVGNSSGNVIMWYDTANSSIANFGGSVNNFLQITHTNRNTGNNASTDFSLFDTNGITGSNYVDIGIAGNAYSNAAWTILSPSDGYVYSTNSNFAVGVAGSNNINFFAGGSLASNKVMSLNSVALALSNNIALIANGSNGSSGQVLTSNGTGLFWNTPTASAAILNYRTVTSNTTILSTDNLILANGTLTITLPASSIVSGQQFYVKNINNNNGIINIVPTGSDLIDGYTNATINYYNTMFGVISIGTGWVIF